MQSDRSGELFIPRVCSSTILFASIFTGSEVLLLSWMSLKLVNCFFSRAFTICHMGFFPIPGSNSRACNLGSTQGYIDDSESLRFPSNVGGRSAEYGKLERLLVEGRWRCVGATGTRTRRTIHYVQRSENLEDLVRRRVSSWRSLGRNV
jgi:hypothetical protein